MQEEQLEAFLQRHAACDETTTVWGGLRLRVAYYLSRELPPTGLVSSARCMVLRAGEAGSGAHEVLVVREQNGAHLLPGGRREPHETVEETAQREVLEETGWTVTGMRLLGFLHYHHLTPRPEGYQFPYPDFLQVIFTARAHSFRPERMFAAEILEKEHVVSTEFVAVDAIGAIPVVAAHLLLLKAALRDM